MLWLCHCLKTDGLIYLPEIKYRRALNKAFGPGGWGLAPRSETNVGPNVVSREYALVCLGRYVFPTYLHLLLHIDIPPFFLSLILLVRTI